MADVLDPLRPQDMLVPREEVGLPGGVAGLDAAGHVPAAQLDLTGKADLVGGKVPPALLDLPLNVGALDAKCFLGFRDTTWRGEGAVVTPRLAVISSGTGAVTTNYLDVSPAFSQLVGNALMASMTTGTMNTTTVPPASLWEPHDNAAAKTISAVGTSSITWSTTTWNGRSGGGMRSLTDITPGEDVVVSLNCSITGVAANREVYLIVCWYNTATGQLESQVGGGLGAAPASSMDVTQGRRVSVVLPNPGAGATRRVMFYLATPSGQDNTGVVPVATISNVLVSKASEVGTDPVVQPSYSATALGSNRDIVARVDPGTYFLVGRHAVSGAIIGRRVTVPDANGLSLLAAVKGGFRFSHLWLIPPALYAPIDVEAYFAFDWQNAVRNLPGATQNAFSTRLGSLALGAPFTMDGRFVDGASARHSVQVAENVQSLARFRVQNGDVSPADSGTTKERAEVYYKRANPYASPFVTAGWFTVDQYDAIAPQRPIIVRQMRYSYVPTASEADPGVNPDFTMNMYPPRSSGTIWPAGTVHTYAAGKTAARWGLQFRSIRDRADPHTGAGAGLQVLATPDGTNLWTFDVGQQVYITTKVRLGAAGTGTVEVWLNTTGLPGGSVKILDLAGAFGYSGITDFEYRFGLYDGGAGVATTPRVVRHHMVEFGATLDAAALADFPPPRLVR